MEQVVKDLQAGVQDINGVQMVTLQAALLAVQEASMINILNTVEDLQKNLQEIFEQQEDITVD